MESMILEPMIYEPILYGLACIPFYIADSILTKFNINSPYYILHVIHNILIVYLSYPDIITTYTDFHNLDTYTVNYSVPILVSSFHVYHIVKYRNKLRFDDWLHHGLMIGVAIPLGLLVTSETTLMTYSLFWATGFPGAISYFSLFLQRNGILDSKTEKGINTWVNVWIRSPGCISLLILSLVHFLSREQLNPYDILGFLPALLMYWNGQYFMRQAVEDYTKRYLKPSSVEV